MNKDAMLARIEEIRETEPRELNKQAGIVGHMSLPEGVAVLARYLITEIIEAGL
jgi:hypothetical protein